MRDERLRIEDSILLLKNTMARQVVYYMKDERLQVKGSVLLLKISLCLGRQVTLSGMRDYKLRAILKKHLQVNTIFPTAKARQRAQPNRWQFSAKTSTR